MKNKTLKGFNYAFIYYIFYDAGISERIETELVSKTDTFVRESVTDTRKMKRLLKIIAKTEMFKNENLPQEPLMVVVLNEIFNTF